MAAGDRITENWQLEYNGWLAGGDVAATNIVKIDGLADMPGLATSDLQLLRRHGMWAGDDFMVGRTVGVELEIEAATDAALATELTYLANATAPGIAEIPLCFQIPGIAGGGKRQVMARPRKRSLPIGLDYYYRMPIANVEWFATDPHIYDQVLSTVTLAMPSGDTGVTFPIGFVAPALTFGSGGYNAIATCINAGSTYTRPTITVTGPVVNPSVQHNSGAILKANVTIPAGQTLTFDTSIHTVTFQGVNYYSTLDPTSRWFEFTPGTNTVQFRADSTTAATATITWRSCWI